MKEMERVITEDETLDGHAEILVSFCKENK